MRELLNKSGHRTWEGSNDGGGNEGRESRGERARDEDGSFPGLAILPCSMFCCQILQVLACMLVGRQDSYMPCTLLRGVGERFVQ